MDQPGDPLTPPRLAQHDLFHRHIRRFGAGVGKGGDHPAPPPVVGRERVRVGKPHRLCRVVADDNFPSAIGCVPGKLFSEALDRVMRKVKLIRTYVRIHLDQRAPHIVDHGGVAQRNTVRGHRSVLNVSCASWSQAVAGWLAGAAICSVLPKSWSIELMRGCRPVGSIGIDIAVATASSTKGRCRGEAGLCVRSGADRSWPRTGHPAL